MSEFPTGFNDILENDLQHMSADSEEVNLLKNAFRSRKPIIYKGPDLELKLSEKLDTINSMSITGNFRFANYLTKEIGLKGAWNWKILLLLIDMLAPKRVSNMIKGMIVSSEADSDTDMRKYFNDVVGVWAKHTYYKEDDRRIVTGKHV